MERRPELTEKSRPVFKEIENFLGNHHIVAKIRERKELGIQRYGQELHTFNGRNPFRDAQEEVLDLLQYSVQIFLEGNPEDGLWPMREYLGNLIHIFEFLENLELRAEQKEVEGGEV